MTSLGKSWSAAAVVCPRVEHARFDGHYGKPGHRRQMYRCVPGSGLILVFLPAFVMRTPSP